MKREPFPLRSLCILLVCLLILPLVAGCKSLQAVSKDLNNQVKSQTTAVSKQVTQAEVAVNDADAANVEAEKATLDAMDDPGISPETKAKLAAAQKAIEISRAKHRAAAEALKPINVTLLPKIDTASDKQLQATVDATNEGAQKERLITDGLVAAAVFGAAMYCGFGVAVSLVAGALSFGVAGIVLGTVSAVAHDWGRPAILIAAAAAVVLYLEKHWKGSWKATLHSAFDESKQAAKNLPADVDELWGEVERLKAAAEALAKPTPDPTKAA